MALRVKHCYVEAIFPGEKNEKQYGANRFRNLEPKCKTAKSSAHLPTKTENATDPVNSSVRA